MNSTIASSNYQILVPKHARRKLKMQKGQIMYIKSVTDKEITYTTEDPIDKYYGILKGVWTEDPVEYQRRIRAEIDR
jgi:bifunctional DNA-binding transcriptional regulator/antitoxin component of YhaV-PrlF toxin-antitoxin module